MGDIIMANNLTTENQFKMFVKESRKWINIFNLNNWEFDFIHIRMENAIAKTVTNSVACSALVQLNTVWESDTQISTYEIKKTAFHEICEVLLARLKYLAEERFLAINEVDTEAHNIIHILEHVIFDKSIK